MTITVTTTITPTTTTRTTMSTSMPILSPTTGTQIPQAKQPTMDSTEFTNTLTNSLPVTNSTSTVTTPQLTTHHRLQSTMQPMPTLTSPISSFRPISSLKWTQLSAKILLGSPTHLVMARTTSGITRLVIDLLSKPLRLLIISLSATLRLEQTPPSLAIALLGSQFTSTTIKPLKTQMAKLLTHPDRSPTQVATCKTLSGNYMDPLIQLHWTWLRTMTTHLDWSRLSLLLTVRLFTWTPLRAWAYTKRATIQVSMLTE